MMIKIYNEEKLSTSDRNNLSPSMYGLPDERKFPLNDSNHIRSAIAFFSHCDNSKKKELAKRIIKAAKIHNITISKDSEVYKALYEAYNDTNNYNVILEDTPKPVDADTTDDEDSTTQNTPNNTVDADTTDDEDSTTQNTPNNTVDADTTDDEDSTTQNTPNNTVSSINNTNNTVRSDTSNDNNQSDFGNGSPEQPMDTDDDIQDSDVGDDSELIDNDRMDTSADSQDNSDDQLSQTNSDIQNLQQAVFSNLTEEQIRIKTNNQKQQYIDLFNDISDILKRILVINKNNNNAELFNYIADSFSDLRKMIKDALTDSFNTRSFVENQIILERFIAIYTILFQLIKKSIKAK
jgi:hypothetical protein